MRYTEIDGASFDPSTCGDVIKWGEGGGGEGTLLLANRLENVLKL